MTLYAERRNRGKDVDDLHGVYNVKLAAERELHSQQKRIMGIVVGEAMIRARGLLLPKYN